MLQKGSGTERIMIHEEHFSFTSNEGNIKIHGMRWIPQGEVHAVVQLVHGMAEHIERYRDFALFLAGHGILVVGHDHLGHGQSVESDEGCGYFAKENGNRILIQDMHRIVCMTKKEYKGVPYVMFGHSMGSFLTRQYLCCHGAELDGAVICGTGNMPELILRAAMGICRIEAALRGWKAKSALLEKMSFGTYNNRFKPNRTVSDWLSRDEQIVDAYIDDAKCGFTFTVNGYYNLFLTMYKVGRKEYLERMPRELPVLFIAGSEDPVGDFGKGVRAVAERFTQIGMEHVQCKLYEGDRHEILNELDRQTVYEDVLAWVQAQVLQAERV